MTAIEAGVLGDIFSVALDSAGNLASPYHLAITRPILSYHLARTSLRLRTLGGLWVDGSEAGANGPRPRRLALLALLGAAGAKGVSRERLLGVLWPESEPEKGRHALSQTQYALRRDLGADVLMATTQDLRIDLTQLTVDVVEFRAAIAGNDLVTAAALYEGPFLDGFYLAEAPEFERWVEMERQSLARDGIRAIEAAARSAGSDGRWGAAVAEWRRLAHMDPLNSRFATSYMESLAAIGDRQAAIAHGAAHSELLRRELNADPDPTFQRLTARLKDPYRAASTSPDQASAPAGVQGAATEPQAVPHVLPSALRRFVPHIALAAAVAAFGFAAWRAFIKLDRQAGPVLAVGQIRDLVAPDSAQIGGVLSEMLATSLGRLSDLRVIANSRILELTPRNADTIRTARTDAARRAGATEILEGELTPLPDRQLRLTIRRVDIARGLVRRGYQLTLGERVALFDSVTILIAADLRVGAPTGSLAEVSTHSPIAYRFYEDGLRAFFQYDARAAHRLFQAAIKEDSTFAMATYYAWRSADSSAADTLADRAIELASRTSERDRLLIMTHVASTRYDPRAEAAAESLATRFPNDPEALLRAGAVIPSLPHAVALLNRSVTLDSAAAGPMSACRLCDALSVLTERYRWADSLDAAERTLNRWTALRPSDYAPWISRAELRIAQDRRSDAEAALARAVGLGAPHGDPNERKLIWALRTDDIRAADSLCRAALATEDRTQFERFRRLCTIALRMQGRFREALALTREGRAPNASQVRRGLPIDRTHAAILDMEMGRPLSAADQFQALGRTYSDIALPAGVQAHEVAWHLTLVAMAATEGNDTLRARRLVDSIEAIGTRSLFGRDRVLHMFVRGLLKARAHQHSVAIDDFRAAVFSPSFGYTRVSYELGRSLLALDRPEEAITVLRGPLRGPLDDSGLFLTRTQVHELLAQAFEANRQPDSAAAHYGIVERAWRGADPILAERHAAARARLALGRRITAR